MPKTPAVQGSFDVTFTFRFHVEDWDETGRTPQALAELLAHNLSFQIHKRETARHLREDGVAMPACWFEYVEHEISEVDLVREPSRKPAEPA